VRQIEQGREQDRHRKFVNIIDDGYDNYLFERPIAEEVEGDGQHLGAIYQLRNQGRASSTHSSTRLKRSKAAAQTKL